jgi:hypothetical protein
MSSGTIVELNTRSVTLPRTRRCLGDKITMALSIILFGLFAKLEPLQSQNHHKRAKLFILSPFPLDKYPPGVLPFY